jgi:hypothetical protein
MSIFSVGLSGILYLPLTFSGKLTKVNRPPPMIFIKLATISYGSEASTI